MADILFGIFLALHGLVHMLYFGQSARYFELQPGLVWPDGSWAFSSVLGNPATRLFASIALVFAALGFVAGGTGILLGQAWAPAVIMGAAAFSAVIIILFWNGKVHQLPEQGAVGLLIDLAILAAVNLL